MGDELAGIEEDVKFNWEGASSLEQELRSTASTLDSQVPQRNGYASDASEEWRGAYSRQFRAAGCRSAAAMRGGSSSAMDSRRQSGQGARRGGAARAGAAREGARVEARAGRREHHGQGRRLPLRRGRQAADPAARAAAPVHLGRRRRHRDGGRRHGHEFRTAGRSGSLRRPAAAAPTTRCAATTGACAAPTATSSTAPSGASWTSTRCCAGFGTFIDYNEIDARWVAKIADAFRRAGGDGSIKTLPDAAIHASLKAAGLLGGRQSVTFDDPVAYGMPADHRLRERSGQHRQRQLRRARGATCPSTACSPGCASRGCTTAAPTAPARSGPAGPRWADARLHPRHDGAEYVGPDGQRALFPRMGEGYGRVLGVAALVEPGPSRARAATGSAASAGNSTRPACRCGSRRARAPSALHARGRAPGRAAPPAAASTLRVHWDGERIAALECSDGRTVELPLRDDGDLVEADGAAGPRHYELGDGGRVLSVTDADGVVEVANALRRARPRAAPALPVRPQHRLRLPARPRHGHQRRAATARPTSSSTTPHGRLLHADRRRRDPLRVPVRRLGQPGRGHRPQGRRDRAGVGRARQPDAPRPAHRRRLHVHATTTRDRVLDVAASDRRPLPLAYEGDERSPAELIDAEGGVTRLTVEDGLVHEIVDPDGVRVRLRLR